MDEEQRIFSGEKGAVMIKSSTKNRIIELLKEGGKTSGEIRDELDKAKSTISVHLSDLKDLGIIKEKRHPEDERKKIFYLSSKLLGKSDTPFDTHYREILENLKETEGDEYEFLKSLFHLIRYGLISFGLDIHPALKEIGKDAGRSIAEDFSSENEEELKEEIGEFWSSTGLGEVEISEDYITIEDCFDCGDMPEVGHTLCSLDEGMIEGIYEERLGEEVDVQETECFGTGERHCRFKIES